MRRRLPIFLLVLTVLVLLIYSYVALTGTQSLSARLVLALPFVAIWLIPVAYWSRNREGGTIFDELLQGFAFLSMGWVSFALVLSLMRDVVRLGANLVHADAVTGWLSVDGGAFVFGLATLAVLIGALQAASGPKIVEIEVPMPDLPPELDGYRIVQISDLHVSTLIRKPYVERMMKLANGLNPDLVALTGDIIDGPLHRLKDHAQPLAELGPKGRVIFITGNHEYYAGAPEWIDHFKKMGMTVLENSHVAIHHKGVEIMVAGVNDPAVRMIDPKGGSDPVRAAIHSDTGALAKKPALKILLAHNPKIAGAAAPVGYDLQLSGHTHAGQFLPWTIAVRFVHAPHYAGLSREGKMWVYVSAGTGTWGPPVRLGTVAELTLLKLVKKVNPS